MGGLIACYAIGLLTQPDSSSSSSSINAVGDDGDSSGGGSSGCGGCESYGNNSGSSRCWQVAGLKPCLYISIATPHLGCSSRQPEEVSRAVQHAAAAAGQLISARHAYVVFLVRELQHSPGGPLVLMC